jgi:hypothetical protein
MIALANHTNISQTILVNGPTLNFCFSILTLLQSFGVLIS